MPVCPDQHLAKMLDRGVDRARDETGARTKRHGAGRNRRVDRAHRRRRRACADPRRRRKLTFCQAVDLVIEHQYLQIHVPPEHVHQMIAADAQPVAVAGNHPNVELGVGQLDTRGKSRRAAMDGVKPIGRHVIGQARRAADAGHEYRVLALGAEVGESLLHRLEDRVIAATGTPANFLVGREIVRLEFRRGGGDVHVSSPMRRRSPRQSRKP